MKPESQPKGRVDRDGQGIHHSVGKLWLLKPQERQDSWPSCGPEDGEWVGCREVGSEGLYNLGLVKSEGCWGLCEPPLHGEQDGGCRSGESGEGGRHSTSAQLTGAWPGDCVEPIAKDESTYAVDAPLLLTTLVARSSSSSCSPTYVLSLGSCPFGDSRLPT